MANLGEQFNSSDVPVFDLIPKGDYKLRICDSAIQENSRKTGNILKLTLEIVEGPHTGRKVWDQLNLSNDNEMAVKIGRERLSAYCHATGVQVLQDTTQLHGIVFIGKIIVKQDKNGDYDDRNEVRNLKKIDNAGAGDSQGFSQGGFTGNANQGGFANQNQGGVNNGNQGQHQNQAGQGYGNPNQNQGGFNQAQNQVQNQTPNGQGFNQNQNQGFNQNQGYGNQGGFDQNQNQGGFQQNAQQGGFQQNQPVDNSQVQSMEQFQQNQNQNQGMQANNQNQQQNNVAQGNGQEAAKAPWEQ